MLDKQKTETNYDDQDTWYAELVRASYDCHIIAVPAIIVVFMNLYFPSSTGVVIVTANC